MSLKVLYLFGFVIINVTECKLSLRVRETSSSAVTIDASWSFTRSFEDYKITWDAVSYTSEVITIPNSLGAKDNEPLGSKQRLEVNRTEITIRQTGSRLVKSSTTRTATISENLKVDQQYRVCVAGSDPTCLDDAFSCGYFKVTRYTKVQQGLHLYLVFGPVYSTNITVTWAVVPRGPNDQESLRTDVGYRLSWRKLEGRIGGHPGHSSNVVSSTHIIKGLQPATRYEICVGETLLKNQGQTCDVIRTEEDLPGPPSADVSTCQSQARGTHWRCDVTWKAPDKTNGRIIGYSVFWRDQEGYTLLESSPRAVLCDPYCLDSQVLTFHPHEACIRAKTTKGIGWESCVLITDFQSQFLSIFDSRFLLIVTGTLFVFTFGSRIAKALLRCCVRGLHGHLEMEKKHPV